MNQELCDIKNMLFEMAASVRHLNEEIAELKSEINLSKQNDNQCLTTSNCINSKEETKKEKKTSPTPLSKVKIDRKKKRSSSSGNTCAYARPQDEFEVQKYIDEYLQRNKKAIEGVIDAEEFLDDMEESSWTYDNGRPVRDWKRCLRMMIRYRSDLNRKEEKAKADKLAVIDHVHEQKVKEQNVKAKNKSDPNIPHVGHVEVNKPVFQDRKGSCTEDVWLKLQKAGYTFEQLKEMDEKGLPLPVLA